MPDRDARPPVAARVISLAAAATVLLLFLLFEEVTGRPMAPAERYVVPLLLAGAAAGIAHAIGLVPRNRHARALAGPTVAWPVMAAGLWALFAP